MTFPPINPHLRTLEALLKLSGLRRGKPPAVILNAGVAIAQCHFRKTSYLNILKVIICIIIGKFKKLFFLPPLPPHT